MDNKYWLVYISDDKMLISTESDECTSVNELLLAFYMTYYNLKSFYSFIDNELQLLKSSFVSLISLILFFLLFTSSYSIYKLSLYKYFLNILVLALRSLKDISLSQKSLYLLW